MLFNNGQGVGNSSLLRLNADPQMFNSNFQPNGPQGFGLATSPSRGPGPTLEQLNTRIPSLLQHLHGGGSFAPPQNPYGMMQ